MIWLRCRTRATSVSKNHEPFTGINLPVPEMTRLLGHLLVMVAFPAPFPTQGHSPRLQPPHWPPPSRNPCPPLPLGTQSCFLSPQVINIPTVFSSLGRSGVNLPIFRCIPGLFFPPVEGLQPFPRVKASAVKLETFPSHLSFGLKLEPRNQHRRGKRSLSNSIMLSLGDKPKPFLTHGGDRKAIPRLQSH